MTFQDEFSVLRIAPPVGASIRNMAPRSRTHTQRTSIVSVNVLILAVYTLELLANVGAFEVTVVSPGNLFSDPVLDILHGDFGQSPSGTITAKLVAADDSLACSVESLRNAAALNGSVAIARRGACSFQVKLNSLMAVGALAAIIVQTNAVASPVPVIMTAINYGQPVSLDTIPGAMVSFADGNKLIDAVTSGTNVTMSVASAPAVSGDIAVLEELYSTLGGTNWQFPYGWNSVPRGNPCVGRGWFGVRCNSLGRVHALNVPKMNLAGALPVSLSNLVALKTLFISSNAGLRGSLPDVSFFPQLRMLEISSTGLLDTLSASLGGLSRLLYFKGDDTKISGSLPAGLLALPRLQYLSLAQCLLSGSLPSTWNLPSLKYLSLQGNKFAGVIAADAFSTLLALQTLDLSNNQFAGAVPRFVNMTSLQGVTLRNNLFSSVDADGAGTTFVGLSKLTTLDIALNRLSGNFFSIAGLPVLEQIDVSKNALSGPLHASFATVLTLRAIVASSNQVTAPLPAGLFNLRNLERVDLSFNKFDADFSAIFIGLVGASPTTLTSLDLSNNLLTGSIEFTTQPFGKLSSFDVSHNRLSGPVYGTLLANFEKVEYLDLSSNAFAGVVPQMIGRLNSLRYFSIANNTGMLDASLPSFVIPTDVFTKQPGTFFSCPTLSGQNSKLQVYIDHNYNGYQLCKCERGYYGAVPDCRLCLENSLCGIEASITGLNTTMVAPRGYYPMPYSPDPRDWRIIVACSKLSRGEVQCNPSSSSPFACAEGYEGRLCSKCAGGFYREGFVCTPCNYDVSRFTVAVFVIFAVCWFIGASLNDGYSFIGQAAMSVFTASQIVSIIIGRTAFHWPDEIYSSSRAIAWTLLSPEAITCLASMSPTQLLAYRVLLPLFAGVAAGIVLAVYLGIVKLVCWKTGATTPVDTEVNLSSICDTNKESVCAETDGGAANSGSTCGLSKKRGTLSTVSNLSLVSLAVVSRDRFRGQFRARWARVFLMILDLSYIPILFGIVNAFSCEADPLTGERFSRHYPWMSCDGSAYSSLQGIAIASIVVYVVGVPLLFVAALKATASPRFAAYHQRLVTVSGFYSEAYRPGCRYYEIVVLSKRIFFVILSSSNIGSYYTGVVFVFVVLATWVGLTTMLRPFHDPRMNRLETVSGYVTLLAIVSGVIFSSDVLSGSVVTCEAITFTIGCLLMGVYPFELLRHFVSLGAAPTVTSEPETAETFVQRVTRAVSDPVRRISVAWADEVETTQHAQHTQQQPPPVVAVP
eukprot:Opistho-2@12966